MLIFQGDPGYGGQQGESGAEGARVNKKIINSDCLADMLKIFKN